MTDLTGKQARFVAEYLIDLNATQAAIRTGYSAKTAYSQGQRLLKDVEVAAAIAAALATRSERTEITQDMVLRELWAIATANPNELIEYRRGCCRYCYGEGHRYQETQGERDRRLAQWERDRQAAAGKPIEASFIAFDDLGGIGFDRRRDPFPTCTECCGEGDGEAKIKDTRHLSSDAMRLYAGVKVTKEGIEVKMHDKVTTLAHVGKHLGMFIDKHQHEVKLTLADLVAASMKPAGADEGGG